MPIRLVKACKELNIGISTAVDFLAKTGNEIESNPNFKLSDDLYLKLAKEFNKDMALKLESDRLIQERQTKEKETSVAIEGFGEDKEDEKPKPTHISVEDTLGDRPAFKTVGQIDLDKPKAKPAEKEIVVETPQAVSQVQEKAVAEESKKKAETADKTEKVEKVEKVETPSVTPIPVVIKEEKATVKEAPATTVEKVKEKPQPAAEQPKESTAKEVSPTLKSAETPAVKTEKSVEKQADNQVSIKKEKVVEKPVAIVEENVEEAGENEVFAVEIEQIEGLTIKGSIDLGTLNQSTRPKPLSREAKRKERERKAKTAGEAKKGADGKEVVKSGNSKKRRERISNQRVDIDRFPSESASKKAVKASKDKVKRPLKTVVDEEEVDRQIKETLARMAAGGRKRGKGAKYRREKRDSMSARQTELEQQEREQETVLQLTEFVTVSELAVMMDVSVNEVIATCMSIGMMVSINQRLDAETINIVAEEFGFTTEFVSSDVIEAIGDEEPDSEEDLESRAPIVTVMGHVDHGKTSLLDYIRKTNVIAGEAGGITQHIGAYNVKLDNGQRITFLDTPGHEAFTAMRARGAKVTDIAIIIVAADDSVMPQTVEAINHASAAGVPIVFAINKVDKPSANPDKIKETLANMNYLVEEWGGKYQSQDVSAKQGIGMKELLEKVLLEAELLDLKANPKRRAMGSIIESSLDKGRGFVSTILVENGTLKMGDIVLAGTHFGRVKAMFNERNQRIDEARPSEPVLILGLNGAPTAGDNFNVIATEQEARDITNKREQLQREQSLRTKKHFTLDELGRRIALGDFHELNVIVKGDVDGSIEALSDSLINLSTENIQVNVIHKAVGAISDSDILLAAASNAIICGFQVRPTVSARKMAEHEEIDIRLYSVIYDAIEEIKLAMEGMLSPEIKEEITASVEILEVFKISKVGSVAGCIVREGKIKRSNKIRVIRDGIVVYTGELDSLKRFKDDVKEVGTNFECGLNVKNYNDIKVGDIIESFEVTEVKQKL